MRSGSFEDDPGCFEQIDEQPIGFDVTFSAAAVVPEEFVVAVLFGEGPLLDELAHDRFDFRGIFAATKHFCEVAFKAAVIDRRKHRQRPSLPNTSSASEHSTRFSPASVSLKIRLVSSFGSSIWKGISRRNQNWA